MSLSRGDERRRAPALTFGKWMILVGGFILFVLVSFVLYIRTVDADYRQAEKQAIRIAKEQGGLTEIMEASTHTWDETVWVVTGKDGDGEEWIFYERESELVKLRAAEHVSRDRMLALFKESRGEEPIRMMPGWFRGQPAWEVRYWSAQEEDLQSIDFYSLKDGSLLRQYVLSGQ
ncbi:DUF5590 domain-containing protein [Paenibacillaceae bacterium WGS1546]|uniref:cell wall elongation regulator TseB-like domain-containing protein n=1 Tax=Cohnella sp. WGS1546 TaxID=3366810 RepID=UPI00372CF3F7